MVPAKAVDNVLEFVLDLELYICWFEIDAQLREVGHEDCADNAVGAVDEEVAAVAGETEEDNDAAAEFGGVDGGAGLRFDEVDPAFRRAGYDMVTECSENCDTG